MDQNDIKIIEELLAKQTEELLKRQTEELDVRERRIGALMEDMQGSLNLIIDGQQGLV